MPAFDYAEARAVAEELIAEFGASATLRKKAVTGSGANPTVTTTDYPTAVVDLEIKQRDRDGTLVGEATRTLYISTAGLSVAPEKRDTVQVKGVWCEIAEVRPLSPANVVVLYEVSLTR